MDSASTSNEAKKRKIEVTPETQAVKERAIKVIFLIYLKIADELKIDESKIKLNIIIGAQVMKATQSILNFLRKGKIPDESLETIVTQEEVSKKIKTNILYNRIKNQGWIDHVSKDKLEAFGTLMPLVGYFSLFSARMQELRIGLNEIQIGKKVNGEKKIEKHKLSILRLDPSYSCLLQGLNYPPEFASSLARSQGPLVILNQIRNQTGKFQDKYVQIMQDMCAGIGCAEEFIQYAREQGSRTPTALFPLVGNLLKLTGVRKAHKYAFPANWLLDYFYTIAPPIKNQEGEVTMKPGFLDASIEDMMEIIRHSHLFPFDASGRRAAKIYHHACKIDWKIQLGNFTIDQVQQLVFHAVFDTSHTSFTLLETLTGTFAWNKRVELGEGFREKMKSTVIQFKPRELKYYSKMLSANPSTLISSQAGSDITMCPFSGKVKRKIEDKCLERIMKPTISSGYAAKSFESVKAEIEAYTKYAVEKIKKEDNSMTWGTTGWYTADEYLSSKETSDLTEVKNVLFIDKGEHYFSPNSINVNK